MVSASVHRSKKSAVCSNEAAIMEYVSHPLRTDTGRAGVLGRKLVLVVDVGVPG